MTPTRDEFDRWRADFVTQWVMEAHRRAADANKASWIEASWETGKVSEAFCDMLGENPRDE
jgi:hypothetical protein